MDWCMKSTKRSILSNVVDYGTGQEFCQATTISDGYQRKADAKSRQIAAQATEIIVHPTCQVAAKMGRQGPCTETSTRTGPVSV